MRETKLMQSKLSSEHLDYVRLREAQERAAAKRAPTLAARRAHQELAQAFSQQMFGPPASTR